MIKIYDMETLEEREILFRGGSGADVSAPVAEILRAVQERGDAALREYTLRFDGAAPDALAVTAEEVDQAAAQVEPAFLAVLEEAAEHIRAYHARQKRESFVMAEREGVVLGQRIIPLARVGIYVPGGTAAYPSTVLMNAIPARIAGVGEIIMVTPPGRDGAVNPHILAAAKIAGVTRIYKVGGAQAVAALAYGTGTIPQVDKIVGPGNAYVAEAKRQVFGRVNIDMIAGPSEVLVLADGRSNPAWVAADLLSQAEHDRMAAAVLVTDSRPLAEAVAHELERQLAALPRAEIARASLEANGKLIVCRDLREGIAVAVVDHTVGRITAAQAADELLNIIGIDTSFVLYPDGDRVIVSARSIGEVNVQVILEKLGGGGNAAAAGGQIPDKSLTQVAQELAQAIDQYLEDE